MKITKAQIKKIIREELTKIMKEDTFHDEERHDDTNIDHLEDIRREINRHIDNLKRQHDRAEGRHEEREDD
jgi:hypothetical protein